MAVLWQPGQSGAERATVLSLLVGIITAILTAVPIWRRDLDSRQAARDLSQAVRADRQRFLDQALAVSWQARPARLRFTDPAAEVLPMPVEALLLHWQDLSGAEAGSIEDVAAFYQNQPSGRLVVLGEPGAGKTVLLSRLVLDLLDQIDALPAGDLPAQVRIPVPLSLPSCNLGELEGASSDQLAHRMQVWITARLREDYGLRAAQAAALMKAQRILPILDGLDEMDPLTATTGTGPMERPRAVAVLRALNAGIRGPVVMACRHTDYRDITQAVPTPAANPAILTDARHVTLRPLDKHEIIAYLTARFHGRDKKLHPRWQPLVDALTRETSLLRVLATPWQLFLVVTAYSAENSDPADLLSLSPTQVEACLLANLVPAVVEHNETATLYGWSAQTVTWWLSVISSHQHRTAIEHGTSETDIYLLELWRITKHRHLRWVIRYLSLTPLLSITLASPGALLLLIFAIPVFAALESNSTMKRIDVGGLLTPRGRRRFRSNLVGTLATGLVLGLFGGLAAGVDSGLNGRLAGGLAFGLAGALAVAMAGDVAAVSSATVLARQCLAYAAVVGLAFALAGALAFGLAGAPPFGLAAGLMVGHGGAWLRYAIIVGTAARQGLLPKRPARFLDWCLHTGLMRMSGTAMQFRHRKLQEALSSPDNSRMDSRSTS